MAEKESKKRKRLSEGVEAPNKKATTQPPTNAQLVKVTFNDTSGPHPVLVSSPGLNAPRISFKAYTKPRSTKQSNNAEPKPSTHSLLLHCSEHPRLDYIATPNTLDQDLSHYVAIFDPAKNELQITPAHHLNLRSTLRSETTEEEKKPRRSVGQQREALGREFGTKKAKKALDDKTVNALVGRGSGNKQATTSDVQSAILDSMGTTGGPAAVDKKAALAKSLASKPIPIPNLDAETVEEVYDLKILLPPQDAKLISIKDWIDLSETSPEEAPPINRTFVAKRVKPLASREDTIRLRALKYLHCLLDFHAALTPAGQGKKVPKKEIMDRKMSSWPSTLLTSVRQRFANPSNELPKFYLERLYTHICALALYVDGFVTDTKDLREDLKLEQKDMVQYFRELGCKISAPTDKERAERGIKTKAEGALMKIAKLRLPLEFPRPRAGRRR